MEIWLYTLVSVGIVSAVSLVGIVTLSMNPERVKRTLPLLISFAAGGLFGGAVIHLLPQAFEHQTGMRPSILILAGIVGFFMLEKFIRWRHYHHGLCDEHHPSPLVMMNLVGDGMHNLIDGMVIGASYTVGIPLGISTTVAVFLHEIPQEIGDFGVLLHGGLSVRRAVVYNLLSASMAVVGAVASLMIGPAVNGYSATLVPIAAGGFLYVAGSDLIPELHHETRPAASGAQFLTILFGIGLMALLALVE